MNKLKVFINRILAELGLFGQQLKKLLPKLDAAKAMVAGLSAVLKNPVVDSIAGVVLGPNVLAAFPAAEKILDGIVMDLTIGSAIEADVKAAVTLEDKLRVFIADMQKYHVDKQDMFLQKIESLILAGLDDKQLKQNLYDLYAQARYSLGKK